jgi:methionyl-tRNA formyltransferase
MALRLVFMGTGTYALPTFKGLYATDHDVVGLVTQPDRTGRGHHSHQNPLKDFALANDTGVLQPQRANDDESLNQLREFKADLFVVAAYGQILSAELLAIPRLGAINLHASLLPKYRGAAPIQFAMISGETETGITIFQIEPKLDAGPILGVCTTRIDDEETYGDLQDRLAELSVPLAQSVIDQLDQGTCPASIQDGSGVTKAPRLKKTDGAIPWEKSARLVNCHIRGVQPWPKPSATLESGGKAIRMLVLATQHSDRSIDGPPGSILIESRKQLFVQTGDGVLEITAIQPEGKRRMHPSEFLNGRQLDPETDRFACSDENI